jgi:hypothetical protein
MITSYIHVQSAPATSWTITHNAGSKVISDVLINSGGVKLKAEPLSVVLLSDNSMQISFTTVQTGQVTVIRTGPYVLPSGTWIPDDITPEISLLTLYTENNEPLQVDPGGQYLEID